MAVNQQQPPQGSVTIGVLIPGECIARVIGKQGAGLKQIREGTGCKLQVAENTGDTAAPRRLSITGLTHHVGLAVHQALMKAYVEESASLTVYIPFELAGVVVGKAGANLKRVREFLAVRLELDRDPVEHIAFGRERKVTLSGPWTHMGQALAMALGGAAPLVPFSHPSVPPHMFGVPTPQQGHGYPPVVPTAGSAGGSVGVRQASADPEELQLHLVVRRPPGWASADRLIGALLGKEGSQIKQLQTASGCKLCMTKKDLGERRVVIIGKYSQCVEAHRALQQQLQEAGEKAGIEVSPTTIIFYIRTTSVGAVIGKGGATLKLIREQTGAKVQVERDEVQGQRPCIITGTDEQVMSAVKVVHSKILEDGDDGESTELAAGQAPLPKRPGPPPSPPPALTPTPAPAVSSTKGAGAVTAKRQRVDGEGGETKLLVPAKTAGAVIGKQGSGLKQIREACNVRLEMFTMAQAPQWKEDRVVLLQGPCESRRAAAAQVLQAAFQTDQSSATLKMLIANGEAGAVIGKSGAKLKTIREQCGLSVHVEKHEVHGERLVSAQGPLDSLFHVASWVILSLEGREEAEALSWAPGLSHLVPHSHQL